MDLLFSHQIDKIMLYSDYWENDVITSCIPTVKHAEKKFISTVIGMAVAGYILKGDSHLSFIRDEGKDVLPERAENSLAVLSHQGYPQVAREG